MDKISPRFSGDFLTKTDINEQVPKSYVLLILAIVGAIYSRTTQKIEVFIFSEKIFRYITDTTPTHIIESYQNN